MHWLQLRIFEQDDVAVDDVDDLDVGSISSNKYKQRAY